MRHTSAFADACNAMRHASCFRICRCVRRLASCVIRHTSCVMRHASCVMCQASCVMLHASCVRFCWCVRRHASCVMLRASFIHPHNLYNGSSQQVTHSSTHSSSSFISCVYSDSRPSVHFIHHSSVCTSIRHSSMNSSVHSLVPSARSSVSLDNYFYANLFSNFHMCIIAYLHICKFAFVHLYVCTLSISVSTHL